jgi:hypothetical protein
MDVRVVVGKIAGRLGLDPDAARLVQHSLNNTNRFTDAGLVLRTRSRGLRGTDPMGRDQHHGPPPRPRPTRHPPNPPDIQHARITALSNTHSVVSAAPAVEAAVMAAPAAAVVVVLAWLGAVAWDAAIQETAAAAIGTSAHAGQHD